MNKIQRENELKMRVWNDTIKDSLVQVYGEENVLEVEPFTFCVPELDCEGNETCLKIKLTTPRKNAEGEEYDMYEEAKAYKATLETKREDERRKREKERTRRKGKGSKERSTRAKA